MLGGRGSFRCRCMQSSPGLQGRISCSLCGTDEKVAEMQSCQLPVQEMLALMCKGLTTRTMRCWLPWSPHRQGLNDTLRDECKLCLQRRLPKTRRQFASELFRFMFKDHSSDTVSTEHKAPSPSTETRKLLRSNQRCQRPVLMLAC